MPQPIDANTELARATAAARVQEVADRLSLTAQQRHAQVAREEQVSAESVVRRPPQSEHESAIGDKEHKDERRGQTRKDAHEREAPGADSHGAGDLPVIAEPEQHHLDVNA